MALPPTTPQMPGPNPGPPKHSPRDSTRPQSTSRWPICSNLRRVAISSPSARAPSCWNLRLCPSLDTARRAEPRHEKRRGQERRARTAAGGRNVDVGGAPSQGEGLGSGVGSGGEMDVSRCLFAAESLRLSHNSLRVGLEKARVLSCSLDLFC